MMNTLYKAPGESILNASGGREKTKKIYRLLNHIEELLDNVLESIATATMAKVKTATEQGERVLFIQDTTSISYGHRKIDGMGYYCDSSQKGMNVHSCIAVTESGIVLGMVYQETQTGEEINHEYTIKEAIHDLTVLGGRKSAPSDGLAGVNSIWKGLFRLGILLEYASFVL